MRQSVVLAPIASYVLGVARKRRSRIGGVIATIFMVLLALTFVGTLVFLYFKSRDEGPSYKTDKPLTTDIVRKAVATGKIVPRREVQIIPRVSGIVQKVYVEPGDKVEEGALIADIRIVPDMAALSRAEASVRSARISLRHASGELKRVKDMEKGGLVSRRELSAAKLERDLRRADLVAAQEQLRVVREGAARRKDESANTKVRSTVTGTVLEVPIEEGGSVIETNNFNAGTPIATVADMGDMIFLGQIDEADVDKVRTGMEVRIRIGAIDDERLTGKLEYIAPKGNEIEGAVQFEIKAAVTAKKELVIRAGYSANAEIVLDKRSGVLALSESLLQFDGDKPYVEIETAPGTFERRDLELGISDGINIEVLSGIDADAVIKKPEPEDDSKK